MGLLASGQKYEFMQLNRELEGPGTLAEGSFDYAFFFKNIDFLSHSLTAGWRWLTALQSKPAVLKCFVPP